MEAKDKILHVAMELFNEKGYHSSSLRDIAQRSGLSAAMVNYHFQTKENLMIIILEELQRSFQIKFGGYIRAAANMDMVRGYINRTLDVCWTHRYAVLLCIHEQLQPATQQTGTLARGIMENHREIFFQLAKSVLPSGYNVTKKTLYMAYYTIFGPVKQIAVERRLKTTANDSGGFFSKKQVSDFINRHLLDFIPDCKK